jgi:hypothetical protein
MAGSLKQAFGDNIYHHDSDHKTWLQLSSHHSLEDGTPNAENVEDDTKVDRVLIATDFIYWGGDGPAIPEAVRRSDTEDIVIARQGHKCRFDAELVAGFLAWLTCRDQRGYVGKPHKWS